MQINLRLLRQAQALAVYGSFSRAAESLKIAQPTLSPGIKELEERVGLPPFNRSRSGHEPTDFGRVFLQHASELLAKVGDLEREVAVDQGARDGRALGRLGAVRGGSASADFRGTLRCCPSGRTPADSDG